MRVQLYLVGKLVFADMGQGYYLFIDTKDEIDRMDQEQLNTRIDKAVYDAKHDVVSNDGAFNLMDWQPMGRPS